MNRPKKVLGQPIKTQWISVGDGEERQTLIRGRRWVLVREGVERPATAAQLEKLVSAHNVRWRLYLGGRVTVQHKPASWYEGFPLDKEKTNVAAG